MGITAIELASAHTNLGIPHRRAAKVSVHIPRDGREGAVLRAKAAGDFLARAEGASAEAVQQPCARVTGNYERGNESVASLARKAKGRHA